MVNRRKGGGKSRNVRRIGLPLCEKIRGGRRRDMEYRDGGLSGNDDARVVVVAHDRADIIRTVRDPRGVPFVLVKKVVCIPDGELRRAAVVRILISVVNKDDGSVILVIMRGPLDRVVQIRLAAGTRARSSERKCRRTIARCDLERSVSSYG